MERLRKFTEFIGLRKLPELPHNEAYEKMTAKLKECHAICLKSPKAELYEHLIGFNDDIYYSISEESEHFL